MFCNSPSLICNPCKQQKASQDALPSHTLRYLENAWDILEWGYCRNLNKHQMAVKPTSDYRHCFPIPLSVSLNIIWGSWIASLNAWHPPAWSVVTTRWVQSLTAGAPQKRSDCGPPALGFRTHWWPHCNLIPIPFQWSCLATSSISSGTASLK